MDPSRNICVMVCMGILPVISPLKITSLQRVVFIKLKVTHALNLFLTADMFAEMILTYIKFVRYKMLSVN